MNVAAPPKPRLILVYGTEGTGKTTFGSQAPKPIVVPTKDGLDEIPCDKFPLPTRYDDVIAALSELRPHSGDSSRSWSPGRRSADFRRGVRRVKSPIAVPVTTSCGLLRQSTYYVMSINWANE